MTSRRTKRLDQRRELERALRMKRRRDQNLMCGIAALTLPAVGILYSGTFSFGLGTISCILVAVYFFHAARVGTRNLAKSKKTSSH